MCEALGVEAREAGQHAAVRRHGGVARRGLPHDDDRDAARDDVDQPAGRLARARHRDGRLVADRDPHLRRRVGERVRGVGGRPCGEGRAHERGELAPRLGDQEGVEVVVPVDVLAADATGPGELEVGVERRDDLHRPDRLDLEHHRDRRLVHRREDPLAHREGGVDVGRRAPRGDLHRARHVAAPDGIGVHRRLEGQLEAVQDAQRPPPDLEGAVLRPERGGLASFDPQDSPRAGRGRTQAPGPAAQGRGSRW